MLHFLALARESGTDFDLEDVQRVVCQTPVLCNFAPRGPFNMIDLHRLSGTSVLFQRLLDSGILDGDCLTVTGDTLAVNYDRALALPPEQELIATAEHPFKKYANMQVCFGNLAPEGIVFKVSSLQTPEFSGTALCFDAGEQVAEAAAEGQIQPGHVVVLRWQGPVGSPGIPELLVASAALSMPQWSGKAALVCDGRVSGVSHGALGVHCSPEADIGGPPSQSFKTGDRISFDLLEDEIHLHISDREMTSRLKKWRERPLPNNVDLVLRRYAAQVSQASQGCVLQAGASKS